MTTLPRIATRVLNRPHYITPEAARTILQVLQGRINLDALRGFDDAIGAEALLAADRPKPHASRFVGVPATDASGNRLGYRLTESGVAVVSIIGELVNRGAWLNAYSGLISYEGLRETFKNLENDSRVKAVLLDMDSPGGEAQGMAETADRLAALSSKKPSVAIANGMMASAAYGIGSAAGTIVNTQDGLVGSVGVVLLHADYSQQLKMDGIEVTLIHAGAHKVDGNPYEPLPDDVRGDLEAEVEKFYGAFTALVARGRAGMSDADVRGTEARTYLGADAVDIGFADKVATFDETLLEIERSLTQAGGRTGRLAAKTGENDMTDDQVTAIEDEVKKANALGEKTGADAAKARISAILGHDAAKGRENLAKHFAFDTDLSADAAAKALEASPKEEASADQFDAMLPGAEVGASGQGQPKRKSLAEKMQERFA